VEILNYAILPTEAHRRSANTGLFLPYPKKKWRIMPSCADFFPRATISGHFPDVRAAVTARLPYSRDRTWQAPPGARPDMIPSGSGRRF